MSQLKFNLLPSAHRLSGLVRISEERNLWLRGTLWIDSSVVIEISFENSMGRALPDTNISYFGVWQKKCLFEFQLGHVAKMPTEEVWQEIVFPIIEKLKG